jgi:hypothetical protein
MGTRGQVGKLKRKIVLEAEWETSPPSCQQTNILKETNCTTEQAMGMLLMMHVVFRTSLGLIKRFVLRMVRRCARKFVG